MGSKFSVKALPSAGTEHGAAAYGFLWSGRPAIIHPLRSCPASMPTILRLPGARALSQFRLDKLLKQARAALPKLAGIRLSTGTSSSSHASLRREWGC
jgi:hypothetical protein